MSAEGTLPDSADRPDVMNHPAFDPTQTGMRRKPVEESDTCRICRAEASHEEPLFYPCRCSGSIKFVHQNCLMEWLSHSQKKHCELCKTPFRFTKLYDPKMPVAVPIFVFLRQVIIHTGRSLVAWSRMHLVILVWLCWLPWCMRSVWRALFWFGDGGWFDWKQMEEEASRAANEGLDKLAAQGTSPVPQRVVFSAEYTASMVMSRLADAFPQMVSPNLNLTTGEPVIFRLARGLLGSIMGGSKSDATTISVPQGLAVKASDISKTSYRSSWLEDVGFLKTLTRHPSLNKLLVDTLEGQLITLSIVIAFILIFLIREWVVQQQPVANIPPAVEAQGPMLAIEGANPPEVADEPENVQEADLDGTDDAPANQDIEGVPLNPNADENQRGPESRDDVPEGNIVLAEEEPTQEPLDQVPEINVVAPEGEPGQELLQQSENQFNTRDFADAQQRPGMPDRGTLARAAEIRRAIEEQSRTTGQDWPELKILMDLWTRAGNRPKEVLRLIDEEGLNDELGWVTAAMGRLEKIPVSAVDQAQSSIKREQTNGLGGSNNHQDAIDGAAQRTLESDLRRDLINALGEVLAERGSSEDAAANDDDSTRANAGTDEDSRRSTDTERNRAWRPSPFPSDDVDSLPLPPEHGFGANPDTSGADLPDTDPGMDTDSGSVQPPQPAPAPSTPGTLPVAQPKQNLVEKIMTWLWGEDRPSTRDSELQAAPDDEHVVRDLANEAPFVPMEDGQPLIGRDEDVQDEGNRAAGEVPQGRFGADEAEIVEEAEDLEGVMELVGMQGPVAGLIQNGMFCAVLVSLVIACALWIPYIMGKLFLIILANPVSILIKTPLQSASGTADMLSDSVVFVVGCTYYWLAKIINLLCSPVKRIGLVSRLLYGEDILAEAAQGYAIKSLERLTNTIASTSFLPDENDVPAFSIAAHESLKAIQQCLSGKVDSLIAFAVATCSIEPKRYMGQWQNYQQLTSAIGVELSLLVKTVGGLVHDAVTWLASLRHINILSLNLGTQQRSQPPDFTLAYWDTKDRILTILLGYAFYAILSVLYLRVSRFLHGTDENGKVKGFVADVLYQAGGVMKVILIISIEMIVFPLYCGLLLDVALLPLFRNATMLSRLGFMVKSPYTSLFVHWFVGTCYMFHFALFVSMCRRIMRTGVLYFIRDPDDPTFHPVRDVLERSVFTQLCKIAFSALVYGGLVIVCLGGVVWGISAAFESVFPIHWSSNEPVLEFPVDLLFYNFLMPLAVKVLRPSDGLTWMYTWWFRKCARAFRLSHFLFGEKKEDEEGHHVRRTWRGVLAGKKGDTKNPVIGTDREQLAEDRGLDAFFLRDGRYVRTPASDQVRIPKGAHTFVEVDGDGNRVDGQPDAGLGLHGRMNDQFSTIYIPPHFRLRISAFIFLLWLFAAATGVCLTLLPLVFGRYVFTHLFSSHPRMNDVYAFSIGINILGGAGFALLNAKYMSSYIRQDLVVICESDAYKLLHKTANYALRLVRVLYTYTAFAFLLPSLVALVMELYFIIPLHTYSGIAAADQHTIYFIQDWTLGVLCVKMLGRFIFWHERSRPAVALRNIVRSGWTDPDVRLATRGFIFPATVVLSALLLAPLGVAWIANAALTSETVESHDRNVVYRYSYPALLVLGLWAVALHYMGKAFKAWKARIKDEVYLIGERLHNFGEGRTVVGRVGGTRVEM